ncbi:pseudaminic acid cytidylyltransferase [Oleiphilus sp. HI0009]|uniref:pseudaminic acid cytidylyltransferase n=1 Tax=unclassified Oleiphilus TaxID=2631174 RepID=UPI0007C33513|nr:MULTISPECIES: pseudaminic acid cytidylyltransferase [unclassified Oleiphilus]KZX76442.1 pseudaminic acid cytidylyltransferase [Oleiphilus sp. HI0009]KZY65700.1 pseudaminic acid cytidylyltransferase [Oleiphilus sp. HI0066]KZY70558.1 pseudaminic acid cytidylyltransferase [Oleiphilus sp. HI0067]
MKVALIPARGGSKRIPRKNIKKFCGKPIIGYSVEAAIKSGLFDRVVVSSDDQEIIDIACSYGAEAPFIRPSELSDDFATTTDVTLHAINTLNLKFTDQICCIYATAPFIRDIDLKSAYTLLMSEKLDYVFSATEYRFPIQRALKINFDGFSEMFQKEHETTRSQDLEPAFHDAGQFYFGTVQAYLEGKGVLTNSKSKPLMLPSSKTQDIDTLNDWEFAEALYLADQLNDQ